MKKKIFWVYIASIFVLFLAVGFIARQWWVGADSVPNGAYNFNFPQTCKSNCPDGVKIKCVFPDSDIKNEENCQGESSACADGDCGIILKYTTCQVMGFAYGEVNQFSTYPHDVFQNILKQPINSIVNHCTLVHEYAHTCDPDPGDRWLEGCGETYAQNQEAECEKQALEYNCGGTDPKWEDAMCQSYCSRYSTWNAVAKVWDACMCNEGMNGEGVDGKTCCGCLTECKNAERIKSLIPKTCTDRGWVDVGDLERMCDNMSKADAAHGCDYYNSGSYISKPNSSPNWVEGECEGGTGFDPSQCNRNFSECAVPNDKNSHKGINDQSCAINTPGTISKYLSFYFKRPLNAPVEWPSDYGCMYSSYSCIKPTCDLKTTSSGTTTASSSTTSRALTDTANAVAPLSGVTIKAQKDRGPYSVTDNAIHTIGTTGADGKILMSILLGSWKITAEKQGFRTSTQYVNVQKDTPFNLNFNMTTDGSQPPPPPSTADKTLNVWVRNQTNTGSMPIYGATVKISKGDKSFTQISPNTGDLSFPNLEAGIWNVEVTKPGYTVASYSPPTANVAYPTNQATIAMVEAQSSLTIRTVDQVNSNTTPLSGVAVTIKQGTITKTQTTAANGTTTFANLISGDWVATGTKTKYHQEQPLIQSVSGATPATDLIMDSEIKNLTVRLKTTSGANMENIQVMIDAPSGSYAGTTAANGTAVFNGLGIGLKTITVNRPGWILAANQVMTLDLQEDTTKDIVMQRPGHFSFYVKGRALRVSLPLYRATVKLCSKPLSDSTKACKEQTTNIIGASTFTDYAPGIYYYEARANNYTAKAGTINIVKQTTGSLTVQLEKR